MIGYSSFAPLARTVMNTGGWRVEIAIPDDLERCVIIGAPHTSNWDFILTLLVGAQIDLSFAWVGKSSLFEPPYGGAMRALGGIPVERGGRHNYVEQLAREIRAAREMALVIAPEGTRSRRDYWKSGFYHIAREADVPLVLGFVDYADRVAGLGPTIDPVGDVGAVMARLREFYRDKEGLYPDQFTEPRLRVEEE